MKAVLDEVTVTRPQSGVPTDPLGPVASSSTDSSNLNSPSLAGQDHWVEDGESVLIYCHGEPSPAPLVGDGFALCRCGERVRVVW